ncbi:MAG: hypothetical protein ACP5KN_07780 [Armatimonadota bacterium]
MGTDRALPTLMRVFLLWALLLSAGCAAWAGDAGAMGAAGWRTPSANVADHGDPQARGSLAAIAHDLADAGGTIMLSGPQTYRIDTPMTGDASLPGSVSLVILPAARLEVNADVTVSGPVLWQGGSAPPFAIAGAKTLTLSGSLQAPMQHLFAGDGRVAGTPALQQVPVEWFGAAGDGQTNDSEAFRRAVALANSAGRPVALGCGEYFVAGDATLELQVPIKAGGGSIIVGDDAASPVLRFHTGHTDLFPDGGYVAGPERDSDLTAIEVNGRGNEIANLTIRGFGTCLHFEGEEGVKAYFNRVYNCNFVRFTRGVVLDTATVGFQPNGTTIDHSTFWAGPSSEIPRFGIVIEASRVVISSCHFEDIRDDLNPHENTAIYTTGYGTKLVANHYEGVSTHLRDESMGHTFIWGDVWSGYAGTFHKRYQIASDMYAATSLRTGVASRGHPRKGVGSTVSRINMLQVMGDPTGERIAQTIEGRNPGIRLRSTAEGADEADMRLFYASEDQALRVVDGGDGLCAAEFSNAGPRHWRFGAPIANDRIHTKAEGDVLDAQHGNVVEVNDDSPATLAGIRNGIASQVLVLIFRNSNTTVINQGGREQPLHLRGNKYWNPQAGDTLTLVCDGRAWYEIARSEA